MSEQQRRSSLPPAQRGEDDQGKQLAQEIAEAPERLRRRPDIAQVLGSMRRGVLIELRITRPRFTVAVAGKRKINSLGPEGLGLIFSEEGERVLSDYFTLGRHSLLPKSWQESLNTAETAARRCLADASIRTHWGAFVPAGAYKDWHEANERYKRQFLDLKERILSEYDDMRMTVEADYRRMAEDAWAHATFGRVALQSHNGSVSQEMVADLSQGLTDEGARQEFIERYMSIIETLIPTQQDLADAFEYEMDLSYIPLPGQLAQEAASLQEGDEQQGLRDQAELEVIEARRDVGLEATQAEQQLTEEMRRRNEEAQAEIDRAVLRSAREQKEKLAAEFYADVVGYINTRIAQVCVRTRESIERNNNTLRGPVADSLRDLVTMMEHLNIVEDQGLEEQINKLREALPSEDERKSAKSGAARIDTTRIEAVVCQMEAQAEQTLLELDLSESPRTRRAKPLTLDQETLLSDERRSARSQSSALPAELASSRRSRSSKAKKS